jgi:tripartite-type tricarboxylate transporter receptor subunit TctC
MSEVLGVPITVGIMTGAAGGLASDHVWRQPKDGYVWIGITDNLRHYAVTDFHHTRPDDWVAWLSVTVPAGLAVAKDSPFQTLDDLVAAMRERPGEITVASGMVGNGWYTAWSLFRDHHGLEYKHVPFPGGAPAVAAAIAGEAQVAAAGFGEMVEFLRGGQMRALAIFDTEPAIVEGYGEVPPITNWAPELEKYMPFGAWFGPGVPVGTPQYIIDKIDEAFNKAMESDAMKEMALARHANLIGMNPEESAEFMRTEESLVTWLLYDLGMVTKSPADAGIERLPE